MESARFSLAPGKKRILVTGGAGFIGTHLCRRLAKDGHAVTILDLKPPADKINDVRHVFGDVREPACLKDAVAGVDAVFHFAAVVSVPLCQRDPVETYRTNLLGTCHVLDAVAAENAASGRSVRMIFASSAAVYGALGENAKPLAEPQAAPVPVSYYGAQKLGSEQAMALYQRTKGVPGVVFRFFNVYGPGQDPTSPYSGVISVFSEMLRGQRALRLNGGGAQTRDFISVHDLIDACVAALALSDSKCDAAPINLGSGHAVTVRELAQEMIACAKASNGIETAPARAGDIEHSLADIARARSVLGWAPKVSLKEGLKELLNGR